MRTVRGGSRSQRRRLVLGIVVRFVTERVKQSAAGQKGGEVESEGKVYLRRIEKKGFAN